MATPMKALSISANGDQDHPTQTPTSPTKFQPMDRTKSTPNLQLPDELWTTVLETQCTFPPEVFHEVMLNLIKNPNITSSHLFRADISCDSGDGHDHGELGKDDLTRHLKAEYRPRNARFPDYEKKRTIVRELIPRNPQLDSPLVQTCLLFQRLREDEEENVVIYVPHIQREDEMPFYHPTVAKLAFHHTWRQPTSHHDEAPSQVPGTISVSYNLFPDTDLTPKLSRTALRLLQTVHKHGQGLLAGYEKRVHLDRIFPQKRYQDTYTRLKATYGKQLTKAWVEVTDPVKHVFEDIGIAAFLIELWQDMYAATSPAKENLVEANNKYGAETNGDGEGTKPPFPGFVDIGCGNGVLVYILLSEGYSGWGFDARMRKTWSIFPPHVQSKLEQRLLVPQILLADTSSAEPSEEGKVYHSGVFAPGTFIVSNHADELTPWTPLLAYLNDSAFIAIPCCSHDLSGARFRAPPNTKASTQPHIRLPQQQTAQVPSDPTPESAHRKTSAPGAAETGSLKRTEAQKKMPSAYATLCSYVASLAEEVGFIAETDYLRIPSTRNHCIIGRTRRQQPEHNAKQADLATKQIVVVRLMKRELNGRAVESVGRDWVERAEKLAKKPASGH
ncbi:hypothetical protein LTR08_002207 [Meristemomyces frigidus]|nr:hypothetical protein LTR08_002207 [Meristemomyces frigidus]